MNSDHSDDLNQVTKDLARDLTVQVVAAHVSRNDIAIADLPALIRQVYAAFKALGGPAAPVAVRQEAAVPIRKSITPDYLICLENGRRLKMLKRHLATSYGLTPRAYRERWGLPADYPMVAPNYAKARSDMAKTTGLGIGARPDRPIRG
ncbi:MAG TPA: MucR family transcriptional regulator [Inquilinus sp.]|nr:MucR family transcriptional regulator [Inquilinus sp.]